MPDCGPAKQLMDITKSSAYKLNCRALIKTPYWRFREMLEISAPLRLRIGLTDIINPLKSYSVATQLKRRVCAPRLVQGVIETLTGPELVVQSRFRSKDDYLEGQPNKAKLKLFDEVALLLRTFRGEVIQALPV
jgi:hypothetical protein